MSLVNRRRRPPAINIVPLVDVLTVLLFFFLVTMQFKQVSVLNITVPKIETAGKNEIKEQILIAVSAEGEFFYNDRPVDKEQLEGLVQLAGDTTPDMPVLLIADEDAPLKHVTLVMDLCRSHRLNKLRLQSR
ncbi:ExbD/TolR family protein [Coraliomargarita parva]|uniref:ExbD/TolR family protein n=1 Tax=Coraliomargarita parva TaxID=3014050 RepID=UPI0022B59DD6|nr:biopolymer transporter ExbD [Coraliomargarita parva]